MIKQGIRFALILILIFSTLQTATATSVFLTSDNIGGENNDLQMLNSVKNYIEEISGGEIEVIIDSLAPSPGEGTRAIESSADVKVNFAASDCGNFQLLAKSSANTDKQIIFVNTGNFDLDEANFIRRAWDDNYSNDYFAGINNPGTFLKNAGIEYIQPLKEYPNAGEAYTSSSDEINHYIAEQIVEKINSQTDNPSYDENLIVTHTIHPSVMAQASSQLVDSEDTSYMENYGGYTAGQVLYLTSSYLNGNGLKEPSNYDLPDSPLETSIFAKESYSVYDYMKMGSIVKNYMDENGRAPNYINYEGAYLAYPDIQYNFARITENHTSSNEMDFASHYRFIKVNHSILIDSLPFVVIGLVLLLIIVILRKIRGKRNNRRRRRY